MAAGGSGPTRLYTRTGDRGETGLAGGVRVAKDAPRITAFGTLDELGAHLGVVRALLDPNAQPFQTILLRLQNEVFIAQAELAVGPGHPPAAHPISDRHVERLEGEIDQLTALAGPVESFVLPGGRPAGAQLHVARTVARRAERTLWTLHRSEPLPSSLLRWMNRVSDLLFAMTLAVNHVDRYPDQPPDYSV